MSCHLVIVVIYRDAALEKSKYLDSLRNVISDLEARGFEPNADLPPPPKREGAAGGVEDTRMRALETDLVHARERSVKGKGEEGCMNV